MSKGLKKIVGLVASIAIPFVAPGIASAIGLSGAVGATAGSALVGAGLGAVNAAATGGNVGQGALFGGLGGGLRAYSSGAAPAAGGAAAPSVAPAVAPVAAPAGLAMPAGAYGDLGNLDAVFGGGAATPTAGLSGSFIPSGPTPDALAAAGGAPSPVAGLQSFGDMGNLDAVIGTSGAATPSMGTSFTNALKAVPGQIAAKFSDPKALADMTLRAAGMLAGSAAAGSGLSPEEQQLLAAQQADLARLRETDEALFRTKLEAAQQLIGESKYFDPNVFREQAEAGAKINIARQAQEASRGLTGQRRAATQRQYQLGSARTTPAVGLQAANQAQQARLGTLQAGLSALPGTAPTTDYSGLMNTYANAASRRRQTQSDIGTLFGSITGPEKAKQEG